MATLLNTVAYIVLFQVIYFESCFAQAFKTTSRNRTCWAIQGGKSRLRTLSGTLNLRLHWESLLAHE